MFGIPVDVLAGGETDELIPTLDGETQFLTWSAVSEDPWNLGFNVDALVVFDCNKEGVARNIDLLVPESRWGDGAMPLVVPSPGRRRFSLRFSSEVFDVESLRLPVTVQRWGRTVCVAFVNEPTENVDVRPLSGNSWAGIQGGRLVLLAATLSAAPVCLGVSSSS